MYSAINTEDYPKKEPVSGNRNLAVKALSVLAVPALFVSLSMSITMFNILCEMAGENGWDQILLSILLGAVLVIATHLASIILL